MALRYEGSEGIRMFGFKCQLRLSPPTYDFLLLMFMRLRVTLQQAEDCPRSFASYALVTRFPRLRQTLAALTALPARLPLARVLISAR